MILNSPYISGSLTVTGNITACGGVTISGSIASASYAVNSSYLNGSGSGEFVPTGSFNTASGSFSTRISAIEGKYITTGSNTFIGNQTITGSILQSGSLSVNGCIVSTGQIVAQTINVQQVTSSVVYSCGSNIFGCAITDVQQMTGSLRVTGSLNITGISSFNNAICAPRAELTSDATCVPLRLINGTITGGSAAGVTALYFGDVGSGVGMIKREKYAVNQANLVLYSEYGYNIESINACLGYSGVGFFTAGTQRQFIDGNGVTCFSGIVCSATGIVSGDVTLNSSKSLKFASNANSYVAEEYGIRLNLGGTTSQYGTQFYNSSGTKVAMIDATGAACFSGLQICSSADPSFYFYRSTCNVGSGIGRLYWNALDSTSTQRTYAYVQSVIEACSSTALCSRLEFILASNNNIARVFQINGAGVACFTGAVCSPAIVGGTVSGTTGVFSGQVCANSNLTAAGIIYGRTTNNFPTTGAGYYAITTNNFDAERGGITIQVSCATNTLATALTINYLGAATFSSSVTAASGLYNGYTSGLPPTTGGATRGGLRLNNASNIAFDFGTVAAGQAWIQISDANNYASNFALLLNPNGGNVGINNTTPCGKLQISLGTVANGCFRNSSGGEAALTIEACGNSYLQFMNCATSQTGIMFGNTCLQYSGMIWYRHDAKQLMLGAGGTETMYICGGRVGVATSTPSAGFHSIGSLKYQNNTYNGFAQSFVWQSSFDNPPQLLYQFTSGNNYAQTLVKVTFIQNGVSAGYAGWFVGYALAHRNPTTLNTVAYAMTAQHNPNGITAPTLSWTNCALCITPNRATNYDGYVVYLEWGGNTNNNSTPEIPV